MPFKNVNIHFQKLYSKSHSISPHGGTADTARTPVLSSLTRLDQGTQLPDPSQKDADSLSVQGNSGRMFTVRFRGGAQTLEGIQEKET